MLTIVCGEDSISSRDCYLRIRKDYLADGVEICDIKATEFEDIHNWFSDSISLFSDKKVFFTENLNKRLSIRSNPSLFSLVEKLAKSKSIGIVDWEDDVSARELKLSRGVIIKEFKPSVSIFKLLDVCYPHNLKQFIDLFHSLPEKIDDVFIFIMLVRHIRNLIIVKTGNSLKSLQSLQASKLKLQSKLWNMEALISFYEGLYRIDMGLKTGRSPLPLRKSLDLLAAYFL